MDRILSPESAAGVRGERARDGAACRHCGLRAPPGEIWCCYGCELAAKVSAEAAEDHATVRGTLTFSVILAMAVMMLSTFLYAEDVYGADAADGFAWMRSLYRWASAVLATPVVLLAGVPLFRRASRSLVAGRLSMEALIGAASLAAYLLSIRAVLRGQGGVYFESACAALVLATFGRYLEASARSRASALLEPTLDLAREPVSAGWPGESMLRLAPAAILPGMRVEVSVEQVVPSDLRLESAAAELNLGVLSGESSPVTARAGDFVPAGAVPVSGAISGTALSTARESTLERLAGMARELRERPSRLIRWADGFASALTPIVLVLAAGTFAYWTAADSIERGVVAALAVVLVACPCSYSIAAPLVHWLAMRRGLAGGVLVRTAEGLESLAAVRTVAFDKTGTLTGSDPMIQDVRVTAPVEEVRGIVFALEEGSRHPIARALHEWAEGAAPETVSERRFIPGTGVIARDGRGRELALGAPEKLSPGPREDDARVILLRDGEEIAAFSAGESLRPEAAPALEALKRDGLDVLILTGDNEARGEEIGRALGVPVRSGQRPEDKVRAVQEIAGGREGTVAMVGDGLNDAPALAALGPSIAMEGATGLARGVAGVLLLRPDLRLVPWTLSLSRRATQLARRLLIASTVYNLGFVALAMCGALAPVFAGLSMLISSLGTMGLTVAFTAEGQEAPTPAS